MIHKNHEDINIKIETKNHRKEHFNLLSFTLPASFGDILFFFLFCIDWHGAFEIYACEVSIVPLNNIRECTEW